MSEQIRTNWAGNYRFGAQSLAEPGSVAEVQQLVQRKGRCKALGAGHSFNGIADTEGTQLSLNAFQQMELDRDAATVRVGAGVRYAQLAQYLDARGFALHNLASLPHISVAGACATGTHGSGSGNGNLSTAVVDLELVTASGNLVKPPIDAATVGLGALEPLH